MEICPNVWKLISAPRFLKHIVCLAPRCITSSFTSSVWVFGNHGDRLLWFWKRNVFPISLQYRISVALPLLIFFVFFMLCVFLRAMQLHSESKKCFSSVWFLLTRIIKRASRPRSGIHTNPMTEMFKKKILSKSTFQTNTSGHDITPPSPNRS